MDEFSRLVSLLVARAPEHWVSEAGDALRSLPADAPLETALRMIPRTNNPDLAVIIGELLRAGAGKMSWEAAGWSLRTAQRVCLDWQSKQDLEFLWAGPEPASQVSARRIDQVLYDLISGARNEIILVTFAAARVERLSAELLAAAGRGVRILLVLEFEEASEGQLSFDALRAFPTRLIAAAEVYQWPVEKRERNQAGRPGKLHAKMAVIDGTILVSSANLTDDAFNRNLEAGVMVRNAAFHQAARTHLSALIESGILAKVPPP
ncbi:MAG TPA: DISARM system phospholipase D-like protein DrmC [Candidatus Hydrogenedentes bacterium]|nr:DISARM system phospholipase D-like protein DrmC [Candidatus Hydrogenedentota bacterium]